MDLSHVLNALLSINNRQRMEAEAYYNKLLAQSPADVATKLLAVVASRNGPQDNGIRALAIVLTRRIVDARGSAWTSMSDEAKARIRQGLWHSFTTEQEAYILHKIAHAVAKGSEGWTGLLPNLMNLLTNTNDPSRQAAVFLLLEHMAEYSDDLQNPSNHPNLVSIFQTALAETMLPTVRLAALKALLSLVDDIQAAEELKAMLVARNGGGKKKGPATIEVFQPLAPLALATVALSLEAQDGQEAQAILERMYQVIEAAPKFFQPHLGAILTLMMQVAQDTSEKYDETVKRCAIEMMLTCCKACPGSVRRIQGFAQAFLTLCMTMCTMTEESLQEWASKMDLTCGGEGEEINGEAQGGDGGAGEEQECSDLAEGAIYRLIGSLGGKTMLPIAMSLIPQWLASVADSANSWKQRRVGLVVLSALVESCAKLIKNSVADITRTAVDFTKDAHPRVAAEALGLLNILSLSFLDVVSQAHHVTIFPALGTLIQQSNPALAPMRLRGLAVKTLASMLDEDRCSPQILTPYLDPLLSALCTCLQPTIPPQVQEVALDAVASIASVCQSNFASHYQGFMPGLKAILASPSANLRAQGNGAALRDRAIECIGMIGSAVGKAMFAPDSAEVMTLLATELQHLQPGEISIERMGPATAAVCQALGEGFLPYLPTLVPLLAKTAEMDIGFTVEDVDDDVDETVVQEGSRSTAVLDVRGVGKKRISMNTFAILEKAAALDTLDRYARVLGWRFVEYAEALLPGLPALVAFPQSEQVRTSAALFTAASFDSIVEATKRGARHDITQAKQLLLQCLSPILNKLEAEQDHEGRLYMAQALRDILQVCAESGGVDEATGRMRLPTIKLSSVEVRAMAIKVREAMVCSLSRRGESEQFHEDDQLEDEDYEALMETVGEESELMSHLTDCVGYLIKAEREAFVPVLDQEMLPILLALIGQNGKNPACLVANAICLFDDMIEYCGPAAHKYLESFLLILSGSLERAMGGQGGKGKKVAVEEEEEGDEEQDLLILRQACIYGITQMCKHAPEYLDRVLLSMNLVPRLIKMLKAPDRNSEKNRCVTENVISAILSICQGVIFQRLQVQVLGQQGVPEVTELLAFCVSHLPLYDDVAEARAVNRQVVELLESSQGAAALLGKDSRVTAPNLVKAIASTIKMAQTQMERQEETELVVAEPLIVSKLGSLVLSVSQHIPPEVWQTCWDGLDAGQQQAIQRTVPSN